MLEEAQPHGGSYLGSSVNSFTQIQSLGPHGPGARMWVQKFAEDSSSQSVKGPSHSLSIFFPVEVPDIMK